MFQEFQKIPRWFRDIVVTEKIDGTNAQVHIAELAEFDGDDEFKRDAVAEARLTLGVEPLALVDDLLVFAGSRNRWLTRKDDNFGFAKWVQENATGLVHLGPGTHYGEWWGSGIQRGYGLEKGEKRFSLFNVGRWTEDFDAPEHLALIPPVQGLGVVPILYDGPLARPNGVDPVKECLRGLEYCGSRAAPGFKNPEGVVVWHVHARAYVGKATLGGDGHKGT